VRDTWIGFVVSLILLLSRKIQVLTVESYSDGFSIEIEERIEQDVGNKRFFEYWVLDGKLP
jgi:hypothetical protein